MGLFDIFKTSKKRKKDVTASIFNKMEKETKDLQKDGKDWSMQNQRVRESRVSGMELEKLGDLYGAISAYEKSIEDGIKNPQTVIYNYAYSIDRLAILYRKTKQIDKEISFLSDMIKKHPRYEMKNKWKERREKAKALKEKQDAKK